jgi:hypothetical protein
LIHDKIEAIRQNSDMRRTSTTNDRLCDVAQDYKKLATRHGDNTYEMAALQNHPQQHQFDAKHRTLRVSCGPDPSPDSDYAPTTLKKPGLGSHFQGRAKTNTNRQEPDTDTNRTAPDPDTHDTRHA